MNDLRDEFPDLPTDQAAEILAAFEHWYKPRWMDHDTKRDMLIGFAAGWLAARKEIRDSR